MGKTEDYIERVLSEVAAKADRKASQSSEPGFFNKVRQTFAIWQGQKKREKTREDEELTSVFPSDSVDDFQEKLQRIIDLGKEGVHAGKRCWQSPSIIEPDPQLGSIGTRIVVVLRDLFELFFQLTEPVLGKDGVASMKKKLGLG